MAEYGLTRREVWGEGGRHGIFCHRRLWATGEDAINLVGLGEHDGALGEPIGFDSVLLPLPHTHTAAYVNRVAPR
jgi:hypothetical protein